MGRDKATRACSPKRTTLVERAVTIVRAAVLARVRDRRAGTTAARLLEAEVLRDEVRGVGPLLATGRGLRAAADAGLRAGIRVCGGHAAA